MAATSLPEISVTIIEDDATIRDGYSFLIGNTTGYKVVSAYPSFEMASRKLESDNPDVILLDVELSGMNGIDAIPKIKKILPDVYLLVLTVYEEELMIFRALSNG
ncbi:MAG: response regulator, partial [Chitinophagia bacterium]|nr:response regulator [Chitinophagia bacterium]